MEFTVNFSTDNAAFADYGDGDEIARILRDVANKLESGQAREGQVRDINGNVVGRFGFES